MGVRDWSLRGLIHRLRGHEITLSPTLILVPAMWHNCSCGKRWLA